MGFRFSGGSCCCEGCTIATDTFSSGSSLDTGKWDERSGTWSISSGAASTSSTNALAIFDTGSTLASDPVSIYANVTRSGSPEIRLILDYVDDDNYHFAEFDDTAVEIFKRTAGVNTSLKSGTLGSVGPLFTPRFCLNNGAFTVGYDDDSGFLRVGIASTPHGGLRAGIGRGSTAGTLTFEDVTYENLGGDCPSCSACEQCNDAPPDIIKVVVAGFDRLSPVDCTDYNGTYFVPFFRKAGSGSAAECNWCLKDAIAGVNLSIQIDSTGVSVGFTGGVCDLASGSGAPSWQTLETMPIDCQFSNYAVTQTSSNPCGNAVGGDLGTCHLTAVA